MPENQKLLSTFTVPGASLVAQLVTNPPAMGGTWVRSLGWEDPLEKGTGHPLQYSGLENSMDCMYSIVHGVAKSQTQLSDFDFVFPIPNSSVWGSKCLEDFLKPSITITSYLLPFRSRPWDRRSVGHREGNDFRER